MKKSTQWRLLTAACALGTFTVGPVFIGLYVLAIVFVGWPTFSSKSDSDWLDSPERAAKVARIKELEAMDVALDSGIAANEAQRHS